MEASQVHTPDPDGRVIPFDLALRAERETVREFLAAKQRQFADAENHLLACLHHLEIELASGQHATDAACREVDQQAVQLAREAEHLEQLRDELETRYAEWRRIQEQTAHQQELFLETLQRERQALDEQFAALDRRRSESESLEAADAQRIQQQTARQQELFLETLQRERQALDEQLAALDRRRSEGESLEAADAQRIQQQTARQQELFLETLQRERQALDEQFAALDRRRSESESLEIAAEAQATSETETALQRRYEMVMEDLRELKQENTRLQEQLETLQAADRAPAPAADANDGGSLSWEAQKQRILAALESEFNEDDEEDRRQRLQIEQVVQRTQRIVADKDAEITELKQLLENQSASVGSLAVGAAALGDMLDKDAVIQQERENLIRLQEEWRAKLRQAEVEMSVERAKLGRERSKIEEQLRMLEEQAASSGGAGGNSPAEKPPRNRWLTRLGLKDQE